MIGAGQAGLAMGYFLRRQGRRFVIFERADSIGSAWRERWESLTLFTPRRYSALPGLPFPGEPDGYPTRDEVIAYLERYAETFELPIELNTRGHEARAAATTGASASRWTGGRWSPTRSWWRAGPSRLPYVPKLAEKLADDVFQTHAVGYRRPDEVPAGDGPRCRWRQHRLSDREGAVGDAQGRALGRFSAEAAASTCARARPLLVAHEDADPRQDGRLTPRPQAAHARHADRLEPTPAPEALRGRAEASRRRRRRANGSLRGRGRARGRRRDLGDGLSRRLLLDQAARSSTRTGAYATAAASPMSRASTSSDSPGSTRAARR